MKGVIKMNEKVKIIIVIAIISFIILISYVLFDKKEIVDNGEMNNTYITKLVEDECTEEYEETQIATVVSSTEEKLAANAILILKKYYQKCDHTINEYVDFPEEYENMTEDEVEAEHSDWKENVFEKGKLTLYKEFDDVCGEHFKLRIEDGKVVVYRVDKDGIENMYQKTNISSEYLTETDLKNIQNGLEIYGREELNQTIEDFE